MPPWVSVGPSSTTTTRLPSMDGPSRVRSERAVSTSAPGLSSAMVASTAPARPGRPIDLVDEDDVRHAQVGLARVVASLVAGAQRVDHDDVEVGAVEGQVVVAAVPEDDVRLRLGLRAGWPRSPRPRRRRARPRGAARIPRAPRWWLRAVQVVAGGEALDPLRDQVAVGHGMAHHDRRVARGGQDRGDRARRLALAGARAHGTDRDHGELEAHHHLAWSEEPELRSGRQGPRGRVHDGLVADVAVREDHDVHRLLFDDALEVRLRDDGDAVRVVLAGRSGWVAPGVDAGDLRGREGHHLHGGVSAEDDVEVVEVASRGAHDHYPGPFHIGLPSPLGRQAVTVTEATGLWCHLRWARGHRRAVGIDRHVPADELAAHVVQRVLSRRATRATLRRQAAIVRQEVGVADVLAGVASSAMAAAVAVRPVSAGAYGIW